MSGGYSSQHYLKKKNNNLVADIFSFASVNMKQGETCCM